MCTVNGNWTTPSEQAIRVITELLQVPKFFESHLQREPY